MELKVQRRRRSSSLGCEEVGRAVFSCARLSMRRLAAGCWRATLRRSSHRGMAPLHPLFGGALLATPLADRPKGARPPIKDKPAKELQAAPLQVNCFCQTF